MSKPQRHDAPFISINGCAETGGDTRMSDIGKRTEVGRVGLIKLINSENSLSTGRRLDERKILDGLDVLRTGVSAIVLPDALEAIRQAIYLEYPWATDVTDSIFDDLVLGQLSGSLELKLTPTILVGPPAVGKTSYVQLLSKYLRAAVAILSAAGSADNRFLAGTAKGWGSAEPSFPVAFMAKTTCPNPIIFIDELEKAGVTNQNGSIQDTLLMMVEPTSARLYMDEFVGLPVDISNINWMAGANSLSGISPALRSRFRIIQFHGPKERHFDFILERAKSRIATTLNIRTEDLPEIHPAAHKALFQLYRATMDIRRMHRALRAVYASSARERVRVYH